MPLAALACLGVLVASSTAQLKIQDFKFPDYYETRGPNQVSRLKTLITAAQAEGLPDNCYLITGGMRIEDYAVDGRTNLVVTAPECVLDAAHRTASSTNHLELEASNGLWLEGQGFFCLLTNFHLTISNRVRTIIRQDATNQLATGSFTAFTVPATPRTNAAAVTNVVTTILADHFVFNYPSNLITYTGAVQVDNPQMHLTCARLVIVRGTNAPLERIVAEEGVTILSKQDQSRTESDRLVYSVSAGRELVELTGNARWQDGERECRAERLLFDPKQNSLLAEQNASIRMPRGAVTQSEWLPARAEPAAKVASRTATATNQPVEITARLLNVQLPTTNHPSRTVTADGNVVLLSPDDKTRATGAHAVFQEATGTLELTGNATWQADQRLIKGQALFFDRTNQTFLARRDAYMKMPVGALGKQSVLKPQTLDLKKPKAPPPQFLEIFSEDLDYRADLLTFQDNVRGTVWEGDLARGTIRCGLLSVKFHSNEVENVVADRRVALEQFPIPDAAGHKVGKKLDCEHLTVKLATNGSVDHVVAETNVIAVQNEWLPRATNSTLTRLTADIVTADFFPQTNQVRQMIAERGVTLVQENRRAQGARAVYTGTNNVVELTGHPTAETPEGKITEADVLFWDRAHEKLSGKNLKAEGVVPSKATNRTDLPPPK